MNNKDLAAEMFFSGGMNCNSIADKLQITVQAVNKLLSSSEEYRKYTLKKREKAKELRNYILELYFNEKLKVKDIAAAAKVSEAYVSKLIRQQDKYKEEKERRKMISREKHENQKRMIGRNKRLENAREESVILANLASLQIQNAKAMSIKRKINSDAMIKMNLQHYKYNLPKRRLEYDNTAGVLPRGIAKIRYDVRY